MTNDPTNFPELNHVLMTLRDGCQHILGDHLLGLYLHGSFALGAGDADSDVDFLAITADDIDRQTVAALQALHSRVYALPSPWAQRLEGSYMPARLARREDAARTPLWYVDNGSRVLVPSDHDNQLVVRWVVRERGIRLAGAEPSALMDLVAPDDLRREVRATMHEWGAEIVGGRWKMDNRWAQPFAVISYCRMLHTQQTGTVTSKPQAVAWALASLPGQWHRLIADAWADRPDPTQKGKLPADPAAVKATHAFIAYALAAYPQG